MCQVQALSPGRIRSQYYHKSLVLSQYCFTKLSAEQVLLDWCCNCVVASEVAYLICSERQSLQNGNVRIDL